MAASAGSLAASVSLTAVMKGLTAEEGVESSGTERSAEEEAESSAEEEAESSADEEAESSAEDEYEAESSAEEEQSLAESERQERQGQDAPLTRRW